MTSRMTATAPIAIHMWQPSAVPARTLPPVFVRGAGQIQSRRRNDAHSATETTSMMPVESQTPQWRANPG